MVENHVHHHFQPMLVCFVAESAVVIIAAEARVYLIIIRGGIAMIGTIAVTVGRVVLQDRREPQGCHAQLIEIIEVLADALEVAAMPEIGVGTVALVAVHRDELVVLHRAGGKAVGHQLVEHIGAGETDALLTALLTLFQLVSNPFPVNSQHHLASLCIGDVQIDQQIVGTVETDYRIDSDARIVCSDCSITYIFPIEHQLQRRVLQTYIPVCRLYAYRG